MPGKGHLAGGREYPHVVAAVVPTAGHDECRLGKACLYGYTLHLAIVHRPVGNKHGQLVALVFRLRETIRDIKLHTDDFNSANVAQNLLQPHDKTASVPKYAWERMVQRADSTLLGRDLP